MGQIYLEVTYSDGKPFAAYLQLPRQAGDKAARTQKAQPGLLVDYTADGRPIGVEITSPCHVTFDQINQTLKSLNLPPLSPQEFAPLAIAA
jgi:hypothetical protein